MARRRFLAQLAAWPLAALLPASALASTRAAPLKIMIKSAYLALAEAGHQVQIYLLGEAVVLMRKTVAEATTPVGWPPVAEALGKLAQQKITIYACGACANARGVVDADLANWGAKFGNPKIFVSLVEWAERVITE